MEAYLTSIANRANRKMLAKLRCSNHPLLIEVGRHHEMDVDTRKCSLCIGLKMKYISSLSTSCIQKLGVNSLVRWGSRTMIAPKQRL